MSNLGLSIRISKNSLIELNLLQEKDIVVKFSGGREVVGRLQSWDKAMNLILDNTVEVLGIEDNKQISRVIGLIIIKGSQIQSISLKDGYSIIQNPYEQIQQQQGQEPEEEQEDQKQEQNDQNQNDQQ